MTDVEHPEDEQRNTEAEAAESSETEAAAEEVPAETAAEPVAAEPAAEPVAEEPAAESPAAQAATPEAEDEEVELAPRQRPEIPGADLIPDIVSESDEFLDAEARAAAEAEAE